MIYIQDFYCLYNPETILDILFFFIFHDEKREKVLLIQNE